MSTHIDEPRTPHGRRHAPGLGDPIPDAQRIFRAVLDAFARPTRPQRIPAGTTSPGGHLGPGVGAVLLTLCDEQTPIWVDPALRASDDACAWVRFHTGARLVDAPGDALFVVASAPDAAPALAELLSGTDEEPHRSATLVIDAGGARGGRIGAGVAHGSAEMVATGPGVNGSVTWDGAGLPADFLTQWQRNHAQFPRGVDVVIVDGLTVRALPRSIRLQHAADPAPDATEHENDQHVENRSA